ncbi:MAG: acyltransferase family protein [Lachnospiraceae bacterium]
MMEKRRVDYLDMVKGIGIILVVAGHSQYLAKNALTVIYSFHMPLFFIVSGMVSCYIGEEKRSMKQILKKKLCSLMIPYAVFSLIYLAIYGGYFCHVAGYLTSETIKEYAVQAVSLDGMSVLWFLSALFFAELLFLGVRKIYGKRVTYLIMAILTIVACLLKPQVLGMLPTQTLWQKGITGFVSALLRGVVGAGFLALGYATMELFSWLDEKWYREKITDQRKRKLCRAAELLTGILCWGLTVLLSLYNGNVELRSMTFGSLPIYFLCAYMGSLSLILICRSLPRQRWLAYLGTNSLIIMVTHLDCQFMLAAIRVGQFFVSISPYAKWYCLYFGIALGMTVLELAAIYAINHFAPFLIGKPYPKKHS